jgi:hypothetical protein
MNRIQIINNLIKKNNYKSYLEIGVNTPAQPGYSHDSIHVEIKHGVDPNVETTYKMESDDFFKNHVSQKYDIIFVDGLHLFEQAHRDIVNSLSILNEGGTIVVHDCNPTKEITQLRERSSNAWHGDVWKAILKLRIENPNVEIYTIDADEGCAIIKKGNQELLHTNEKNIYSWDFFNKNRKDILNLISLSKFRDKIDKNSLFDNILNKIFK